MTLQKYEATLMKFSREALEELYLVMGDTVQKEAVKRAIEQKIANRRKSGFGADKERAKQAGDKGRETRYGKTHNPKD